MASGDRVRVRVCSSTAILDPFASRSYMIYYLGRQHLSPDNLWQYSNSFDPEGKGVAHLARPHTQMDRRCSQCCLGARF